MIYIILTLVISEALAISSLTDDSGLGLTYLTQEEDYIVKPKTTVDNNRNDFDTIDMMDHDPVTGSSNISLHVCQQNQSRLQNLHYQANPDQLIAGQRIHFNVSGILIGKSNITSGRVKGTIYFNRAPIWKVDEPLCTFTHHYLYLDCPFSAGSIKRSGFYDPPAFLPPFGTIYGIFKAYDQNESLITCLTGTVIFY